MRLFGEILRQRGRLSETGVDEVLARQAQRGGRFGEVAVELGLIGEPDVLATLAEQFDLRYLPLLPRDFSPVFKDVAPLSFLKKFLLIPIQSGDERFIAANDPLRAEAIDDLAHLLGWPGAEVVLSSRHEIVGAIHVLFDTDEHAATAEQVIRTMDSGAAGTLFSGMEESGDLLDDASEAPTIRLVNLMLSQAVQDRASDIHIEPYQQRLRIRQRIDGILYDMLSPPVHVHAALASRIKVMADLNIAETRLPQDGRIEIRIGNTNVDIRVSTLPTSFGERLVLRLLYKSAVLKSLNDLGMPADILTTFNKLIHAPHGILLITGPTGSGKTTTLYAALATLNSPDTNILTIEDPIEYRIEGISQMQVNPKINLTFARGLRTIVRQDPDIILVGEIRDGETAEIAVQSALTGHLVFSTLHTNDSASAVTRLLKMGVEPFLITSAVNAVLAQRLVRLLCPQCREEYMPLPEMLAGLGPGGSGLGDRALWRAQSCVACHQTGYRGRSGIFELLVLDEKIQAMILAGADANTLKQQAVAAGMRTLLDDGVARIVSGRTSIEEIFRVTRL
ncbi:MAG: type II secretion system ATPase GspE [Thermodesulfobacteriota bacterium]